MPVVDEDDVRVGIIEAKMKGQKPPSRCPLCWDEVVVEKQEHPYGESYVTELLHMDCHTCGIVYDCRRCYRYIIHEPEKHPCIDKVLENQLCRCPPDNESSSSTDPDPEPTLLSSSSGPALTDSPASGYNMEASLRRAKVLARRKARGW